MGKGPCGVPSKITFFFFKESFSLFFFRWFFPKTIGTFWRLGVPGTPNLWVSDIGTPSSEVVGCPNQVYHLRCLPGAKLMGHFPQGWWTMWDLWLRPTQPLRLWRWMAPFAFGAIPSRVGVSALFAGCRHQSWGYGFFQPKSCQFCSKLLGQFFFWFDCQVKQPNKKGSQTSFTCLDEQFQSHRKLTSTLRSKPSELIFKWLKPSNGWRVSKPFRWNILFWRNTLLRIKISHPWAFLTMLFLFPRWVLLVCWRVM